MSSPTATPAPPPQYEFSGQDNETIGSLARSMRGVGFFFTFLGILYLIVAIITVIRIFQLGLESSMHWAATLFVLSSAIIWIYIGTGTRAAGSDFQRIVTTTNHDVTHLMSALVRLRGVYGLIYALILLMVLMYALIVVFQVFGLTSPANPAIG